MVDAARDAAVSSPLTDACFAQYRETEALGLGDDDLAAVVRVFDARPAAGSS
ncbi:hypothetical protein [Burkholderia sp. PU8-34]